jgi:hypothetical protein
VSLLCFVCARQISNLEVERTFCFQRHSHPIQWPCQRRSGPRGRPCPLPYQGGSHFAWSSPGYSRSPIQREESWPRGGARGQERNRLPQTHHDGQLLLVVSNPRPNASGRWQANEDDYYRVRCKRYGMAKCLKKDGSLVYTV